MAAFAWGVNVYRHLARVCLLRKRLISTTNTLQAAPQLSDVAAVAEIKHESSLRLANPTIQKIQNAVVRSTQSNTQDIVTDCPNRDERLGWAGDAALTVEQATYNFEAEGVAQFYEQFLGMFADEQHEDGGVPDIVPYPWGMRAGAGHERGPPGM